MSNSKLVSHSNISPNRTSPRNHAIDTISIHCMAGNLTIEQCGKLFSDKNRKASSNYGIGTDGRIGMYVEEKDRSWCTSNSANDNRAVTIEVANDGGAETGWHISDKAYESLILLLIDICQRNGIKELKWKGDRRYIGKVEEQNMTVHRWFAPKACPGDYLYNLHPKIAADVNRVLIGEPIKIQNEPVIEKDNSKKIWDFLRSKGLTPIATAGLMGNLYAESGLNPNNLQNSYNKKFNLSDEEYTAIVNNKVYSRDSFSKDKAGYGLAQWTFWSRKQALYDFTVGKGFKIDNLNKQLEFVLVEIKGLIPKLNAAKTVREASTLVLTQYEKPADQGLNTQTKRATFSQAYYDKYGR